MTQRKVLIIGIDGGTWSVLAPALEGGFMPNLQVMVREGASGVLESTLPAITPAAWASFQTGVNPGANGVFDFSYLDKKTGEMNYVSSRLLGKTMWEMVSEAGGRVGVVNVPMTYPPREVNGFVASGILTPSLESEFTYPSTLKNELLSAVPDYHIFNMANFPRKSPADDEFEKFVGGLVKNISTRAEAAEFVLKKGGLDIFMVHFQATDVLQHVMWAYLDESHPAFDAARRKYIFEQFYGELDRAIGNVRKVFEETSGREYMTLVISDHGFQRHLKRFNLGNWLCHERYMKFQGKFLLARLVKKFTSSLRLGRLLRPVLSRQKLSSIEATLNPKRPPVDIGRSRAVSMGRSNEGFVYLLEKDTAKRAGTGAEITEKLKAIRDPQNGSLIVKEVHRKEDIFKGEMQEIMPELLIEPEDGYSFTGAYQAKKGLFDEIVAGASEHVGKHHRDGVFIVSGSGIRSARSLRARLVDILPTVLYYLGVEVTLNMDGRVMEQVFTERFITEHPLTEQTDLPQSGPGRIGGAYSDLEKKDIQQRLKDLGYL